jgi:hypothetical protein
MFYHPDFLLEEAFPPFEYPIEVMEEPSGFAPELALPSELNVAEGQRFW